MSLTQEVPQVAQLIQRVLLAREASLPARVLTYRLLGTLLIQVTLFVKIVHSVY